jgi:glycosyl hydrolase family 26
MHVRTPLCLLVAAVAGLPTSAPAAATAPPSPPMITGYTATATSLTISWRASTGASPIVYNIDPDYRYLATTRATSYTVTGLACNTVHTIAIQAVDPADRRSTVSTVMLTRACSTARIAAPLAPAGGVRIGAYVNPGAAWSETAVTARERLLGGTLGIDAHLIPYGGLAPTGALRWDIRNGRVPLLTVGGKGSFPGWSAISSGAQDRYLTSIATALRSLDGRVFLRPFQEMNGSWFAYGGDPAGFVAGWRHMHNLFRAVGATNVVWEWCPNAADQPAGAPHWTAYYPGDAYVDWVGVDGYDHLERNRTPMRLFGPFYNDYRQRKPIMIAETSALEPRKAAWITRWDALLPHMPDIAGLVWFDSYRADRGWNWEITTSPSALSAFRALLHDSRLAAR